MLDKPLPSHDIALVHMIDRWWTDAHGVYLCGWAHAAPYAVRRMTFASGGDAVSITSFLARPDILPHYPGHPEVIDTGFAVYLPTRSRHPVCLTVETDGGSRTVELALTAGGTEPAAEDTRMMDVFERFRDAMKERGGTVLEIGGREVSAHYRDARSRFAPEAVYRSCDIHAAPGVDLVADAHDLTSAVGEASLDGIFSFAVLEHLAAPWLAAGEIARALKIGGLTAHFTHQTWCLHEAPNDFFRFSDQALRALFGPHLGFEVLDAGMSSPIQLIPPPDYRFGAFLEMPFQPGFGQSFILARKTRDLPADAVRWPLDRSESLAIAQAYPGGFREDGAPAAWR